MMNIHEDGLKAMNQFIIQGPIMLIGSLLLIYLLILGLFQTIRKNKDENWSTKEKTMFLVSFGLLIYNVCITWFLAR